jgi:hypothetical protein
MKFGEWFPALCFLALFPLWLRLIGGMIYRKSAWQKLAEHYRSEPASGRLERILLFRLGNTSAKGACLVGRREDSIVLQVGFPFRFIAPHPPLRIPLSRIRMKGRNRGTIGVPGEGIPFEGFDLRDLA